MNKRKTKIMAIAIFILAILVALIGKIYSDNNNHYVVDVVKETATNKDEKLQVTEKIVKDANQSYFDSKQLNYQVELDNITQTDLETQVAILVDTSYSMEINDTNGVTKNTVTEFANGILSNVQNSRVSISSNSSIKANMNTNTTTLTNAINALTVGDGTDLNQGLDIAYSSFVSKIDQNKDLNKFIIIFTDSTDNTEEKMKALTEADPTLNIISVLVDMTSTSYIKDGQDVCGEVYVLPSELTAEEIDAELLYDAQKIYDEINRTVNNITLTNEFDETILNYFEVSDLEADNGSVKATDNGYEWKLDRIKTADKATLKFKLTLKTDAEIDAGVIFNDLYTNKVQNITYTTYNNNETVNLNGVDSREGTESTVIKICQAYDLKVKAVNESNKDLVVDGVIFKVQGVNEAGETICEVEKTTDADGYITITAEDSKALRADGTITYTIRPVVNKIGYANTDPVIFDITNNKITRNLSYDNYESNLEGTINEQKRLVEVIVPINSAKVGFEVKVQQKDNSNVLISGAEFELIQPKLNNKYEMDVLSGATDENGSIVFSPTVMTTDGTYNYILRQVSAPDSYDVTALTLIQIRFENGKMVSVSTQFNPDVNGELITEEHVLITVGNECVEKNPFNLQINVADVDTQDKLEGVTYLVTTTNSNNQVRKEYVTTDENGQINTNVYGTGNLNVKITEQAPKVGYVADTVTKEITLSRTENQITIWYSTPELDVTQSSNRDDIIVNLTSKKKPEQNVVRVSLVETEEQDVAVGKNVVYTLIDNETGVQYGPAVSDKNGELSFVIDNKEQGQHSYSLVVDTNTIPDEYDEARVEERININLIFDKTKYLADENVVDNNTVIEEHYSKVNNGDNIEYTCFITIGYELEAGTTTEFKIKLSDKEDMSKKIEAASYDINIEWDINGVTRTKTITKRKTNRDGEISTRVVKGEQVRIDVTQVEASVGYNCDNTTQEIYLSFKNNGVIDIVQSPYDRGVTNTEEPNQGAYADNEIVIYEHLNRKRTPEDTFVNLTVNKMDMNGAYVDGVILNIKSETLKDKNDAALDLIVKTGEQGSEGTVTIDYAQYLLDAINNNFIRVPGIGEESDEIVYDLEISELQVNNDNYVNGGSISEYDIKKGTTVKLRLIFRYKDNEVTLTNVETIYGNRLVKNKTFSSASDTAEGQQDEDTLGVYLSNITLDLYTNYDDIGNLSLDFKKQNKDGDELNGAKYKLKVTNPDNTVVRKEFTVSNGDDSEDIEISGLNVNVGSIIELTETQAPIGYGVNTNTETLEVIAISEEGEVTLEHKDSPYNPSRLVLNKESSSITTSGNLKTNYEIAFVDYQLDIFEFEIEARDVNTQVGVDGFVFKIETDKGAMKTLATGSDGFGTTKVGGMMEDGSITYTISAAKLADYYKPLKDLINVNVVFDVSGNVDIDATKAAQTDSNYGTLWTITALETYGKIGIQLLVEHQDPLVVNVETIDKITNARVNDVTYKITESEELPATGSSTIEVGYALEQGMRTYNIAQTSIKNSYQKVLDKTFTVTYENGNLKEATLSSTTSEDSIEITGNKEVKIKIFVEPKVPFEISNLYYFDTTTKLQGSNFEVISQRNQDTGTGTTDTEGMAAIYSDILGTSEEIIYKVRQTKGAIGYATVEDFYVKVAFNENREITDAKLVNKYGEEVTDNRFVTVTFAKTSTYYQHNSNDKGIVKIQVLNYPEFKILIENVDRRNEETKVVGTEYSVKSTYVQSDDSVVDFTSTSGVITNSEGIGVAHLDKTKDSTIVTYTVKEDVPATGYQSLGTEIKVIVTFDENGYVSEVKVEDDDNLSKIEKVSKIDPVVNPEDNFVVNLQLKNNPILKFNLTTVDSVDTSVKIRDIGLQIVSRMDEIVYSNSSATNKVNQTDTPETSYTDINGYTASYLDRTLDNKDMYYTIKEVQKSPGYEWADKDIIIKVSYDSNGKIASITPVQGGELINITSYDSDNFEISVEVYNDEIKEFGIHLTAVDTYDVNKKLNDMKVEAFLVEPGNSSYVSDGEYELVAENSLLTGEDRNNDGKPELAYGEDYKTMGQYTKGAGTRTLRLVIKNDSKQTAQSGYYLDSTDSTGTGNNVGHYKGITYYSDAKYQTVKYQYLINVTFDDEGKIVDAELLTGLNGNIGWLVDDRYVQVDEKNKLAHTDYRLNITLRFFPMFDLKLNGMDNYTYQGEVDSNGKPIALQGTKYLVSTQRHDSGTRRKDEFITAGYIGYGNYYGNGSLVHGDIYEDRDELLSPIENNYTRQYYIYEESEPTNYHTTNPRLITHYYQRLVAIINVTFNEYGEIDYEKSIIRQINEEAVEPYMSESGTEYLSANNIPEYNYYYDHEASYRNIDFYIGYALSTKITVKAIDDVSGSAIADIRLYPFVNDNYFSNTSYEYNTISYRHTDRDGNSNWRYWGAAITDNVNKYVIGSSRYGTSYNGYFFPNDLANVELGGSGNERDYYANLDVTYDSNGKISNVESLNADLWGDNNVANITWDSETGNIYINMLYSRKFQMRLNKTDYYDSTINDLTASFEIVSNTGLKRNIESQRMLPVGKIYKNRTVKYTLSETQVPTGYYPITNTIDYYVTFDENGNFGQSTVKCTSEYFEFINATDNTERVSKTSPDLTINIKNKPALILDLRVIDKFYKNDGVPDIYLSITNDKGDKATGNPQTDKNGYANIVASPVYPNETVHCYIKQTNTAEGYYENSTQIELEVTYNDIGKIQDYKIIAGNEVINEFNTTEFMNSRTIKMNIMNMPKDIKIGLYKYDKTTNEPMAGVPFTITQTDMNSGDTKQNTITTNEDGSVIERIGTFDSSLNGKVIKYTLHEDETPASYRTMEDVVFLIRYNVDGSMASCNQIANDNGIVNTKVTLDMATDGRIRYLNDERVHFNITVPNDNAFDIIIKDEDINYAGLGIEGTYYDVSVNGRIYSPEATDIDGKTTVADITESGDITIQIAERTIGEGYREDKDNLVEIQLEKGTEIYSLDLKDTTDGYIDNENATTTKAIIKVDETYGKVEVIFKNESKTELTIYNQDINTFIGLKDTEFKVLAQQLDNTGNYVGDPVIITTPDNRITNANGMLYFDLGVAPQSQVWEYTIIQEVPPDGYNIISDSVMEVEYDQYGRIIRQAPRHRTRLRTTLKTSNYNCRSMYAIIYNGDVSPAYTVKVVTEDAETGKRINDSDIYMNITNAENGDLIDVLPKTSASAKNGTISRTGNLGLSGEMYTDEELYDTEDDSDVPLIIEKGLTYIDNIDFEGTINIEVSQKKTAEGYVFGNQHTDGNIKIKATYVPHLDEDPTVDFEVIENDGFNVIVDNTNKLITITILNESRVNFDIMTQIYGTDNPISGANYTITSEVQTATDSIVTDLNETSPLTNEKGKTNVNVGTANAGKTVVYTLKQNVPETYMSIEDIQVWVQYDASGYIKFCEMLTSEDNAYIRQPETEEEEKQKTRTIKLVVQNRKFVGSYKVMLEKHAMDTDEEQNAYSRVLPGAKYKITVHQEDEGIEYTSWIDTTDSEGIIDGLTFNGFGYINITIEELVAPDGYRVDDLRKIRLYRDKFTGEIEEIDGDVNFEHNEDYSEVWLKPIDNQSVDKYTLIINKYSTATNQYITEDQAQFKAELIKEDENGNIIYKDTIDNIYTDKNGKAFKDNLDLPDTEGEYKLIVTEIEAPEGYVKLSEPVELIVNFEKDSNGEIVIASANTKVKNMSTSKVTRQLIGINIGNDVDMGIKEDEFSLDITKVDAETNDPIADMAIFKVWLPDDKNTALYTETTETLLGPGKLDYCYIEQNKDYSVRLTHMKIPSEEGEYKYVFKEVVAPEGYAKIEEDLELTLEFKKNETTGEMYIANAISSNDEYLRINTPTPCTTSTCLSIDILNGLSEQNKFTITYDANDNGEGVQVPQAQIKEKDIDLVLDSMVPVRDGYTFKGWATLPNATTINFNPGDTFTVNQDITLYAIWEQDLYLKSEIYKITTAENYSTDESYMQYDEGDTHILGIDPELTVESEDKKDQYTIGTTIDSFIKNLDTNATTIKVYDAEQNEITDVNELVGTSMIIELSKGTEKIMLTLVVRGDLNGDGKLKINDITRSQKYIKNDDQSVIDTIEKKLSLDVNVDGRINMKDSNNMQRAQNNDDNRELSR